MHNLDIVHEIIKRVSILVTGQDTALISGKYVEQNAFQLYSILN
jgi:hypothetical protein